MTDKITTSAFTILLFLFSMTAHAFDLFGSSVPSFVFKLGTPIHEAKKDARFKNCKDMGEREIESDEIAPGQRYYQCQKFDDVRLLHLVFFNGTLMTIRADFAPALGSKELLMELAELTTEANGKLENRENALEKVLREKCQAVKSKADTRSRDIPLKGTSMKLSESMELHQTDKFRCIYIKYTADATAVLSDRKRPHTKVQTFILMDQALAMKAGAFAKDHNEKKLKEQASKFKF